MKIGGFSLGKYLEKTYNLDIKRMKLLNTPFPPSKCQMKEHA